MKSAQKSRKLTFSEATKKTTDGEIYVKRKESNFLYIHDMHAHGCSTIKVYISALFGGCTQTHADPRNVCCVKCKRPTYTHFTEIILHIYQ